MQEILQASLGEIIIHLVMILCVTSVATFNIHHVFFRTIFFEPPRQSKKENVSNKQKGKTIKVWRKKIDARN